MNLRSIFHVVSLFALIALLSACAGADSSPGSSPDLETDLSEPGPRGEFINPLSTPLQTEGFPAACPVYPDDFQFVEVPQPLAEQNPTYPLLPRAVPQVGECFHDPQFGTILRRVTQIEGYNGRHEYSRHDPYNSDHSMVILISDQGNFRVYRTLPLPYNQPDNLIAEVNLSEPRWDPQDPYILWGLQDFTLQTLNFSTGEFTVIKDFSQDPMIGALIAKGTTYRITDMDEGESSLDKRYWAFALQGDDKSDYRYLYLFTWDMETDTTLGVYPSDHPLSQKEGGEIDWISMSPLGNWVLIGGMDTNQGNLAGLTLASKDFTLFHRLDYTTAHSDIGLDVNGGEVIVMQNYNTDTIDMIPLDPAVKPILRSQRLIRRHQSHPAHPFVLQLGFPRWVEQRGAYFLQHPGLLLHLHQHRPRAEGAELAGPLPGPGAAGPRPPTRVLPRQAVWHHLRGAARVLGRAAGQHFQRWLPARLGG